MRTANNLPITIGDNFNCSIKLEIRQADYGTDDLHIIVSSRIDTQFVVDLKIQGVSKVDMRNLRRKIKDLTAKVRFLG